MRIHTQELEWLDHILLLLAPYIPFDGMNEYGLAIGSMTDYGGESGFDAQKATIGSLHLIRLVLDHAKNVDEAIALISQYNIDLRYGGAAPLHYLLADASGSSAVVEFVDGELTVTMADLPWQVATNFTVAGKSYNDAKGWCWRYKKAFEMLNQTDGTLPQEEMMRILQEVAQDDTRWSVTFDLITGDIGLVLGKQYDDVFEFALDMKE